VSLLVIKSRKAATVRPTVPVAAYRATVTLRALASETRDVRVGNHPDPASIPFT